MNFEAFAKEFQASFEDTTNTRTMINKIRRLRPRGCLGLAYIANFRLLACNIPWDDAALMNQFRQGLRNDVNDLRLTLHEDSKLLTEAIN